MAWRIAEYVERGEIDCRTRGTVTGRLWLCGRDQPVRLELEGNPWRDLAGHYLRFRNPAPQPPPGHLGGFAVSQTGAVGDITAARRVKVPEIPMEAFESYYEAKLPVPCHWGNSLYLEWHSARNGRVVIETTAYALTIDAEAAWRMSPEEEQAQRLANEQAMLNTMKRMIDALGQQGEPSGDPAGETE